MVRTGLLLLLVAGLAVVAGCGRGYGIENPQICGNGTLEPGELCDGSELGGATCASVNLGDGSLACTTGCAYDVSGCSLQATCGNALREYPEVCDGTDLGGVTCADLGFTGGTLGCNAGCGLDTSGCEGGGDCGNGQREAGEECDGADLGGASCASLGLGTGSLACGGDCRFTVTGCTQAAECGNALVEYPEVCDSEAPAGTSCETEGYYGGVIGCAADCLGLDRSGCLGTCGDALINGPEVCDGTDLAGETCRSQGYYGGTLACDPECGAFDGAGCDGRCGDGALNGPEVCDGNDFGGDSCQARGFYTGSLACANDCQAVDDGACSGLCGDGAINGAEVCDGLAVGGEACEDYGLEGTLRCLADCSAVNLASCTANTLLLTEIGTGNPDWVEILNVGGATIDLDGWSLEWWGVDNGNQPAGGVLLLPAYTLGAGERVVVQDTYGGNPADPPTVDLAAATITFYSNLWWGDSPGAVVLTDPATAPVDFARWGGPDYDPPAGTAWADTPGVLPGTNRDDITLSRVPETADTDVAGDWCRTLATKAAVNGVCVQAGTPSRVLITEIADAQPTDRVELYNPGNTGVYLGNWSIYATNGTPTMQYLPAFVLGPGQFVEVVDDVLQGNPPYEDSGIIHVGNLNIAPTQGAVRLLDGVTGAGVDFVRWGQLNPMVDPTAPDTWADTPAPLPPFPTMTATPRSLGRQSLADGNVAGDWCYMNVTMGSANTACVP